MTNEKIPSHKEENYRRILDVAWDIASKEGLEAISIRKVAAALNFAPNNLYNYFTNKNDLLYHLKKDSYEWTFKCVFNDLVIGSSMKQLLETAAYKLLHVSIKEPQLFCVMTSDLIMDYKEPLDIEINGYVAKILEKGIINNEFIKLDTQITASNIRISLIALVRWLAKKNDLTLEEADTYMANYLDLLFKGIIL